MKRILLISIILCFVAEGFCQQLNNEWINYDQNYYKFTIGRTGLYRINQQTLAAAGLSNIPVEQFQLWRNGSEVQLYTSSPSGPLPSDGYIEFWGKRNDGKPDRDLYKNPDFQFSDAESLLTDTAAFFLTYSTGSHLRFDNALNDIANNTLPADPYFIYDYRGNFKQKINPGKPVYFGEYVYSSTYDMGEFWTTSEIYPATPYKWSNGENLFVYPSGAPASFTISAVGMSFLGGNRVVKIDINGTNVISKPLTTINADIFTNESVPLSVISGPALNLTFTNASTDGNDRMGIGFFSLKYPRLFNFGNRTAFEFSLSPNTNGNYLEITNFNWGGSVPPVLYDLSNGKRYVSNTTTAGILKFALLPSSVERQCVLVSENISGIISVNSLSPRKFVDFSQSANQGDYLIISNKILFGGNNPVELYRQYRSSTEGGGFNAKIVDIDEIVDQFAFGIKKSPLSVKNFLRFARINFSAAPKFAFLIGKAVTYNEYRIYQTSKYADQLNLIPSFGWPASDNILGSDGFDPVAETPIGRLAAIRPEEVQIYLEKIKQYEKNQQNTEQTIEAKGWMKTMVHVVGANDPSLDLALTRDQNAYKAIIEGPQYGANVTSFNRTTTGPETPQTNALMSSLFSSGISLLNYFGHSASTALDYNLNSPDQFSNYGKYPVFLVNGCNAGNIYSFDTSRLLAITSLSENFVLAKDKGAIAFIASSHFGVENYLHIYNLGFYNSLGVNDYGQAVSIQVRDATAYLTSYRQLDSTTRYLHAEEDILHGDPALKINSHPKPDFVVEDSKVIIDPTFISVANNSFNIKAYFYNIGKATGDSVSILIQRQYPDGSISTLVDKNIVSVRFIDSIALTIPLNPSKDLGTNKLIVTIDNLQQYDEMSELNNSVTKTFEVYEDELKPVYPYNFSIVNKSNIQLYASTANPLAPEKQYAMQIDTTELFNSALKREVKLTSKGGLIGFDPGIVFSDSTVYYWRVAPVSADGNNRWNTSSFVYLPNSGFGYNQSHLYQHLKSSVERIFIDSNSRQWLYQPRLSSFNILHAIFPTSGQIAADFQVQVNGQTLTSGNCGDHSVVFNLFDPVTLQPYYNQAAPSTNPSGNYGKFMGSGGTCDDGNTSGTAHNFEFSYLDTTGRRKMRDFMDWIPDGVLVTVRLFLSAPYDQNPFVDVWKSDQQVYGVGNTLYDRLTGAGFSGLDSFTYPRTWAFLYKKDLPSFSPQYKLSNGLYDKIVVHRDISTPDSIGYITSPAFGPARAWKQVKWSGKSLENGKDNVNIEVIGLSSSGAENVLLAFGPDKPVVDISSIDVNQYPFIKLKMRNADSIALTPYQLNYWRILYDPVPEGALAPNLLYQFRDTLNVGEKTDFKIAFKNVSDVAFSDSIKVNMTVYDAGNVARPVTISPLKKLAPGDTATIQYTFDSKNFNGQNNLFLDVNPDNAQPEQFHFNNFLYKPFSVSTDNFKPVLDVTFDGVHILNNDIVSANPHVLVKLKDESKYLLLDDTSLCKIQLQYPDGSMRRFYFDNDTLRFSPATAGSNDNTATIDFMPFLTEDGMYRLMVEGKDKTGNPAGITSYSVSFMVYNKPMISDMFNYPNPFTTSTAFVFTLTGSQVPQNLRIQILTITGKIVKEITKQELGNIHIGRNITDYKWDGTDQYGQKLANGVYLYRVITNLNGNKLDKFPSYDTNGNEVNTEKFFNKGYGKMYLMR